MARLVRRLALAAAVLGFVALVPQGPSQALFDDTAALRVTSAIDPGTSVKVQVDDAERSYDKVAAAGRKVLLVDDDEVAYAGFPTFPTAQDPGLRFFLQGLRNIGFTLNPTNNCSDGGWDGVVWDTAKCGVVSGATLAAYDLVIWYTGAATAGAAAGATLLTVADNPVTITNLTAYLAAGGDLLLESHEYINSVIQNAAIGGCDLTTPYFDNIAACADVANAAFISTYLGITDFARVNRSVTGISTPPSLQDTQPISYDGIASDPIGDSLTLQARARGSFREATVSDLVLAGGVTDAPVLEDNDPRYGANAAVLTCLPVCNPVVVSRTDAAAGPASGRVVFTSLFLENQNNTVDISNFRTLMARAVRYLADAPSVTITNARSGEIETLKLSNSGLGVNTGTLATAAGAGPNPTIGLMDVLAGDTLTTSYTDSSPGTTTTATTAVVSTAVVSFRDAGGAAIATIPVPGSFAVQVDDGDRNTTAAAQSFAVTVTSTPGTGGPDSETFTATETGGTTGVFKTPAIPTSTSDTGSNDGTLRVSDPGSVAVSLPELGAEVTRTFVQNTWHGSLSDNVPTITTTGWTEKDDQTAVNSSEREYLVNSDPSTLSTEWTRNSFPPQPNPVLVGFTDHPAIAGTPFDKDGAGAPAVVQNPATGDFRMYYTGTSGSTPRIGLAQSVVGTSPIGREFKKYPTDATAAPLFALIGAPPPPGDFNDQCGASDPSVVYDASAVGGPWVMYLAGTDCGSGFPTTIGRATSADGLSWTVDAAASLSLGVGGSWDDFTITQPTVLVESAAGPSKYKLWYTGAKAPFVGVNKIGYATSADGITWTKSASNPVLIPGGASDIDGFSASSPSVALDAVSATYVMYYDAVPTGPCADDPTIVGGIAKATSVDGVTWTKPDDPPEHAGNCTDGVSTQENIVYLLDPASDLGVKDPDLMINPTDGLDRLYYVSGEEVGNAIAVAWNFDSTNTAGALHSNPIDTQTAGFANVGFGAFGTTRLGLTGTTASARSSDTLSDLLYDPAPGVAYPPSPPNPNITNGALLSDFPLVTNGQRYLQYELKVKPDVTVPGAAFSAPALGFTDAVEQVDPEVFQRPTSTVTASATVTAAAEPVGTDATVRITDVTFTLNPTEQQVHYDVNDALDKTTKQVVDKNGGAVLPGDQLDYKIDVRNTGSVPLTNVIVTDTVPLGTDYLTGSIFGTGADDSALPILHWRLGTLDPGETEPIGFSVIVQPNVGQGSELLNQAFVNSVETGVIPSDYPVTPAPRDPTIIPVGAGLLALLGAAAAVAGGLTFVRHRPRRRRAVVAVIALLGLGLGVGLPLTLVQIPTAHAAIGTGNDVYLEVVDADQNVSPTVVDTVTTTVTSTSGDSETVTLSETDPTTGNPATDSGVFRGKVRAVLDNVPVSTNGLLEVLPNDTITLSYLDQLNSTGKPVTRTDTVLATVDHLYTLQMVARTPTVHADGSLDAAVEALPINLFGVPAPDGTLVKFSTSVGSVAPTQDATSGSIARTMFSSATVINPSVVDGSVTTSNSTDSGSVSLTTTTHTSTTTTTNNVPLNQPSNIALNTTNTVPPANTTSNNAPNTTPPANVPNVTPPLKPPPPPSAPQPGLWDRFNDFLQSAGSRAAADFTHRIIAPIVAGLAALNLLLAVSLADWYPYLLRVFLEPLQLFGGRRRRPWGVVYDSLTKQPVDLAIVRLYRAGGGLMRTTVTDRAGRFGFLIDQPGGYRIDVVKTGYHLSTLLAGKTSDEQYDNLYTGGTRQVTEPKRVNVNVPIDRDVAKRSATQLIRKHYRRAAHVIIAYAGITVGAAAYLVARTNLSLILLALHLVVLLLFWRLARGKRVRPWGTVYDRVVEQPLPHSIVRIFDVQYGRLLESQVADRFGRFGFLVGKNSFRLDAVRDGYRFPASKGKVGDYLGGPIQQRAAQGIIAMDVPLDRDVPTDQT